MLFALEEITIVLALTTYLLLSHKNTDSIHVMLQYIFEDYIHIYIYIYIYISMPLLNIYKEPIGH